MVRRFDVVIIAYKDLPEIIKELTRLQEAIKNNKTYLTLDSLEKTVEKRMRLMNDGE